MKKTKYAFLFLALVAVLSLSVASPIRLAQAQKNGDGGASSPLKYPETKTVETVDDYFGTKVADPYRWLENNDSPEVAAWVEAQNKVTFAYLDQIPFRAAVKDRLTKLFNYPKYGAPQRRGEWFIFVKERRAPEPKRGVHSERSGWPAAKSCSIQTSFPRTARRSCVGRSFAVKRTNTTRLRRFERRFRLERRLRPGRGDEKAA